MIFSQTLTTYFLKLENDPVCSREFSIAATLDKIVKFFSVESIVSAEARELFITKRYQMRNNLKLPTCFGI